MEPTPPPRDEPMVRLMLLRHGQSMWNAADLFTGWVDIPLSQNGTEEARRAGRILLSEPIDVVHTSTLLRARSTVLLVLTERDDGRIPMYVHDEQIDAIEAAGLDATIHDPEIEARILPVHCDWRLNERNYGELQGLNKQEPLAKYGEEQVHIWRRSYEIAPPGGESLRMCARRTIPYLQENIIPHLDEGRSALVVAHGNSLRSIVMELEGMTPEEIPLVEMPTGQPRIYDYSDGRFTLDS